MNLPKKKHARVSVLQRVAPGVIYLSIYTATLLLNSFITLPVSAGFSLLPKRHPLSNLASHSQLLHALFLPVYNFFFLRLSNLKGCGTSSPCLCARVRKLSETDGDLAKSG